MIDASYKAVYNKLLGNILNESESGFYDEAALASYTHRNVLMSWLFWKRIETALSMAGEIEGKSVLDFGCGSGVTFKYLAKKNCRISGCENEFFELTRSVCKKLNIKADIHQDLLKMPEVTFDRILALDVFGHIEDIDYYIEKLKSLCYDDTKVIISGPTENFLYKIGRKLAGFSGDYHVTNIYDVECKFSEGGFTMTELKRLYFPFTLFRISTWRK